MRSKKLPFVFALVMGLACSGCVVSPATRVAATPPAPQPAPQPPPEEKPISIVQNAGLLPPAQPVPPEALPPLDPPEPSAPHAQPNDAAEAARKRNAARKPAETPASVAAPVAPAPAPVAASSALVTSDANLSDRNAIAAKIADVRASSSRIVQPGMTASQRSTYKRVESFIKLAQQALSRGDVRQAGELADRAATLARALAQ